MNFMAFARTLNPFMDDAGDVFVEICRPDSQSEHESAAPSRQPLPYGIDDLDPEVLCLPDEPKRVRCYVRGCHHILRVPRRGFKGDICPDHGIRCHLSGKNATYTYVAAWRNIFASPDLFAQHIVGHPFKYESHRLGSEKSEDALSWNVFRSLQEAGKLAEFARTITGDPCEIEPRLYLWGICITDDDFRPWDLLIAARKRFESNLPVERPLTEPDIALHLPGRYLILIEAKFTSFNTFYERGSRADDRSLTLDELIEIYHDPALKIVDVEKARSAERIHYQLWRNMVFAEWMAQMDHPSTKAFHVNLVRHGYDQASAAEFRELIQPHFRHRFAQNHWESLQQHWHDNCQLDALRNYVSSKTACLRRAFREVRLSSA